MKKVGDALEYIKSRTHVILIMIVRKKIAGTFILPKMGCLLLMNLIKNTVITVMITGITSIIAVVKKIKVKS